MNPLSPKVVLAPLDWSDPSTDSLKAAAELASLYGGKLLVTYVADPAPYSPDLVTPADGYEQSVRKRALKELTHICQSLINTEVPTSYRVCFGQAHTEIAELAEAEQVDLIVMATHGHSGIRHWLMGSTTERVVRTANCPVLTMKFDQSVLH